MTKQFLVKTEAAKATFLFSGLEKELWGQLKLKGTIATLFYCGDCFHFGKKCFNFGKF